MQFGFLYSFLDEQNNFYSQFNNNFYKLYLYDHLEYTNVMNCLVIFMARVQSSAIIMYMQILHIRIVHSYIS